MPRFEFQYMIMGSVELPEQVDGATSSQDRATDIAQSLQRYGTSNQYHVRGEDGEKVTISTVSAGIKLVPPDPMEEMKKLMSQQRDGAKTQYAEGQGEFGGATDPTLQ